MTEVTIATIIGYTALMLAISALVISIAALMRRYF